MKMCNFCFRPAVNKVTRRRGPIRKLLDLEAVSCWYCGRCLGKALTWARGWRNYG